MQQAGTKSSADMTHTFFLPTMETTAKTISNIGFVGSSRDEESE
jgi:hypothetical protein